MSARRRRERPPAAPRAAAGTPGAGGGFWRRLRRTRRAVQALFFTAWLVLVFLALQRRTAFPLADVFFRLDPLVALATMLAGQAWVARAALAIGVLVGTLLVGRVWCGWVCPLGTLLEWTRPRQARRQSRALPPRLAGLKYLLLAAILTAAVLGNLTLLVLDPLAIITRATGTAIVPGVDWAVTQVERGLYDYGIGQGAVDVFERVVRGRLLPSIQPAFAQALPIFLLLLGVVLLNLVADRFWCRFVCPLGALLGLVSKVSLLRPYVPAACDGCAACARACRVGAIADGAVALTPGSGPGAGPAGAGPVVATAPATVVSSECLVCLDCLVACGKGMRFGVHPRPAPRQVYDPGRRAFLTAIAAGAAGVVVLGAGAWNKVRQPTLLRPPGVADEDAFLSSCVRCSQCMRVCPTSGLQPAFEQAGVTGLWTPVLTPRMGYCDYGCNACGQVCPVTAIPRLTLAEKRRAIVGLAAIDQGRCLPWANDTPCIVCQEMCPLSPKAIALETATVAAPEGGGEVTLQRPRVVRERCIGCGLCEYHCPVAGAAAVRVFRASRA